MRLRIAMAPPRQTASHEFVVARSRGAEASASATTADTADTRTLKRARYDYRAAVYERAGGGAREETSESNEDGCSSHGGATRTTIVTARSGNRIHGRS